MEVKLYVIPASHPSRTVSMMLERKGIPYERVDLLPVISRPVLKALRFPDATIPAMRIDGRRVQGSMQIARELELLQPDPPLFPTDPGERAAVEQAERWGEEVLQPAARRVFWNALRRDRAVLRGFAEGAHLGIPVGLAVRTAAPIVALEIRIHDATDEHVRADLAALPGMLQRIAAWIAEGVLGGEEPNAADLQIATSVRLLMTLDDLRPAIEGRPAGELAMHVVPEYPGKAPPVLPAAWLEPLRESAQVAAG